MINFVGSMLAASVLLSAAVYTTTQSKVDDRFTVTTFQPVQEYDISIFSIPPQGSGEVTAEEYTLSADEEALAEEEIAEAQDEPAAEEGEPALQADDSEIVMKRGDLGKEVRKLQHRLIDLGYLRTGVDGDYGNQTTAAVMQFQEDNGFEQTGDLTKNQYEMLFPEEAEAADDEDAAAPEEEALAESTDESLPEETDADPEASVDDAINETAEDLKPDASAIVAKPGDKGALVYKIQQKLALIHYPCISDGDYGNSTAAAVKKFQADNGYEQTGELTQNQYDLLFPEEAEAARASAEERGNAAEKEETDLPANADVPLSDDMIVSQYGDKGAMVYKIQQRLVSLGYLNSAVDGDFGNLTVNAVKQFQEDNDFEATGRLTVAQFEILFPGESGAAAIESEKPIESYVSANT